MSTKLQNRFKSLSTALLMGLLLATSAADAAGPARNVLDYYRQLPTTSFRGDSKYELTRAKGGWITHSSSTEEEIPVTVDTQNGYISFMDEGTGGGSMRTQVVLFLKGNKSPLIAVSQGVYDGAAFEGKVTLVEPTQGQWKEVTSSVLPVLRLEDFLDARCLAAMSTHVKESLGKTGFNYDLPQQGTTIQVTLWTNPHMFPEDMQDKEALCLSGNQRALKWDKRSGRFTLDPTRPTGKN
jgi:hypothetical protein